MVAAALAVLRDEGPDALAIRRIATVAGVAPMSVYARFASKAGLLNHLLVVGFRTLNDFISVTDDSPEATLVAAGHAYRAFAAQNPDLYRLMFLHTERHFEMTPATAYEAASAFQTLVAKVADLQVALQKNEHPSVDLAVIYWAAVHGFTMLDLSGINFAAQPDEAYAHLLAVTVAGIRAL